VADAPDKSQRRKEVLDNWSRMIDECADNIRSTIAIYGQQNDRLVKDRTGVLFAVGEHYFILTAAHGLEACRTHGIPLYTAPTTPGGYPVPLEVSVFGNKSMDVAVMEMQADLAEQLLPRRTFLRMTDVDLACETPKGFYVIVGYPNSPEYNRVNNAERSVVTNPFFYGALPFDGHPDAELGYDPATHILLKHVREGLDSGQQAQYAPRMAGMSGSGIWRLARFDRGHVREWSPDHRRLVAIETSCKHDSFVKGTWIVHVLNLIAENFPDCRTAMQLTL